MTTYYKAVRPDGTDFRSGTVRWLPPGVLQGPREGNFPRVSSCASCDIVPRWAHARHTHHQRGGPNARVFATHRPTHDRGRQAHP